MAHTTTKTAPGHATAFQPYVPANQSLAEFTAKAVVLGVLFGLIFGASTVYLGLRAGLTVSASIPIAVLAISVLKRLGGSTILENNIVQTIGSAGESVAGGVVFTIPALIFLTPYGPGYFKLLPDHDAGVCRRHPRRADDGAAAPRADRQGARRAALSGRARPARTCWSPANGAARWRTTVFTGLGVGALWKSLSWIFQIFRTAVGYTMARTSFFPNATLNVDISPEYMGVGYVIGPRIAGRHVRRRRAVVAGAAAAAEHPRQLHDGALPAGAGERPADRSDVGEPAVERVHPLHRRRRGARLGTDHARRGRFRRSSRRSATA